MISSVAFFAEDVVDFGDVVVVVTELDECNGVLVKAGFVVCTEGFFDVLDKGDLVLVTNGFLVVVVLNKGISVLFPKGFLVIVAKGFLVVLSEGFFVNSNKGFSEVVVVILVPFLMVSVTLGRIVLEILKGGSLAGIMAVSMVFCRIEVLSSMWQQEPK